MEDKQTEATTKDPRAAFEALQKLLHTPMTEEEGKAALADIEVQVCNLRAMRLNIDQQLAAAAFDAAVIRRRMLVTPAKES